MPQLLDLPTEVLLQVISLADNPADRSSLRLLCQVSKRVCGLAQPVLFRKFSTITTQPLCVRPYRWRGVVALRSVIEFVRSLFGRPDLAGFVREVVVQITESKNIGPKSTTCSSLTRDVERLFCALDQLHLKYARKCLQGILEMRISAWIAILVSLVPNLKTISLILDFRDLEEVIGLSKPFRRVTDSPSGIDLTNLKALTINHNGSHGGFNIQTLSSLLRLPSLDTLTAKNCLGNNRSNLALGNRKELDLAPKSLNMTTIILRNSCVDERCLTTLVAACKSLRIFEYHAGAFPELREQPQQFNATALSAALRRHAESLEVLRFDFRGGETWEDYEDWVTTPVFKSPQDFIRLRTLELEEVFLPKPVAFPPSLAKLVLRDCYSPVTEMILRLLQASNGWDVLLPKVQLEYSAEVWADLSDPGFPLVRTKGARNDSVSLGAKRSIRNLTASPNALDVDVLIRDRWSAAGRFYADQSVACTSKNLPNS